MWSRTEICKFSLSIETDFGIFRKVFDQFHFIRFSLFFKVFYCFISRLGRTFKRKSFFDDFLHLCFDFFQIFCHKRCLAVNVIIETVCNGRSDCKLCIRVKSLDRLCHNMRSRMTERALSFFVIKCQDTQCTVFTDHRSEVNHLTVYFPGCCCSRQSFADVFRNFDYGFALGILFNRSVFQCDFHIFSSLSMFLLT